MQIRLPCLVSGAGAQGDSMGSGMQPASCRFYSVDKTLFFPRKGRKILPIPEKTAPVPNESNAYVNQLRSAACRFVMPKRAASLAWAMGGNPIR